MREIHMLDSDVSMKISAGEVVENPYSIVKELVENAVDAKASKVTVEIEGGGLYFVRVSDDGVGILPEDLPVSVERFATSKVRALDDVYNIGTFGFRGEALAAISSVSDFSIMSGRQGYDTMQLSVKGGKIMDIAPAPGRLGTVVTVQDLFYNVPARKKFVKSGTSYKREITRFIKHFSMINPQIDISLKSDGNTVYHAYSYEGMDVRANRVFGVDKVAFGESKFENMSITVAACYPVVSKSRRDMIFVGINGRVITNSSIVQAIINAYEGRMPDNKYPVCVVNLEIPPPEIDVNVHPGKREIKLINSREVYSFVARSVRGTINNIDVGGYGTHRSKPYFINLTEMEQTESFPKDSGSISGVKGLNDEGVDVPSLVDRFESVSLKGFEGSTDSMEKDAEISDDLRIIGQINKTFILCQAASGDMLFIDQHIAHERVLYEEYEKTQAELFPTISLHEPMVLNVSEEYADFVAANVSEFALRGFKIRRVGDDAVELRSIPISMTKRDIASDMELIIGDVMGVHSSGLMGAANVSKACSSSVKAGDELTFTEMKHIVDRLFATENPYTCPHGRPIVVNIPFKELLKKFDRL